MALVEGSAAKTAFFMLGTSCCPFNAQPDAWPTASALSSRWVVLYASAKARAGFSLSAPFLAFVGLVCTYGAASVFLNQFNRPTTSSIRRIAKARYTDPARKSTEQTTLYPTD